MIIQINLNSIFKNIFYSTLDLGVAAVIMRTRTSTWGWLSDSTFKNMQINLAIHLIHLLDQHSNEVSNIGHNIYLHSDVLWEAQVGKI